MTWLILGILIWICTHSIPTGAPGVRAKLVERLGEGPYKGLFSLALVLSLVLIVIGWRAVTPDLIYSPPAIGALLMTPLMALAFVLFVAASMPSNIKRIVRHPQLTGIFIWSLAHLMTNGHDRSLVLFGGLGAWALITILLVNKRDGAYEKPEALPLTAEIKIVGISVVALVVFVLLHPYFAGVSPIVR